MSHKVERFIDTQRPATPCLIVDLDGVEENFRRLRRALPLAEIYYAVKANPAAPVLDRLVGLGSRFDAASVHEVDQCLAAGADPAAISFGNTVKKRDDIARAFEQGVRLYAFDSEEELRKLAAAAPGARVYCRLLVSNGGAEWPLSRKFGCSPEMARDLLILARDLGLDPHGLSFHVGSQQTEPGSWAAAIALSAMVFTDLRERGIGLRMLNLGGGFPARYRGPVPPIERYGESIMAALHAHFGNALPELIIEPGRGIAAEAGVLLAEVVLVARKDYADAARWVYLDVGTFGGLAETMGESIKYEIRTDRDGETMEPVCIAGPTCDGADILYERSGYHLPAGLRAGDRVRIMGTGAYTATYASVGFNGFPPLQEYYI